MPTIDDERGVLVVRVVYDGAPLSGKTTTLRTLARGLGVDVVSPEERDGRTLFFDWVDYVGGLFEGRQIRCQVISVPGQPELAHRRRKLLESADAIVVVADTREHEVGRAYEILDELKPYYRFADPPVGVVLQANKRDAPDRVSRASIQDALDAIAPIAVVDTVATRGDGVREAFVFGIRLALDRVRALADRGELAHGRPSVDRPEDLLGVLQGITLDEPAPAADAAPTGDAASSMEQAFAAATGEAAPVVEDGLDWQIDQLGPERGESAPTIVGDEHVFVPDPMMPGGFIWPPVDGRTLLHEVSRLGLVPERTPRGDWWASGGGWRFHSAAPAIYDDAAQARQALIDWARLHAGHQRLLSPSRTVILASAGRRRHRLWQLVRVATSLREALSDAAATLGPEALAKEMRAAADRLVQAHDWLHAPELGLRCSLWTVSADPRELPAFVGLMPTPGHTAPTAEMEPEVLLEREFGALLAGLAVEREDFAELAEALARAHALEPRELSTQVLSTLAGEANEYLPELTLGR